MRQDKTEQGETQHSTRASFIPHTADRDLPRLADRLYLDVGCSEVKVIELVIAQSSS